MYISYRVRGYQFKSEKSAPRRNPPAYRALDHGREKLDDAKEKLAEAEALSLSVDKGDLERRGVGEGLGERLGDGFGEMGEKVD